MCICCKTLRGEIQPPGGLLIENACWVFFLRSRPLLMAGQGFIVLKRHIENVADLTFEEQQMLGVIMAKTARALDVVLRPEKTHFGLYGEDVKHIHLHVTPRISTLPAGNIPLVALSVWRGLLVDWKLRRSIADVEVEAVAARLKAVLPPNN